MPKLIALAVVTVLLIGGGFYYAFFYPPHVLEHKTDKSLQAFAQAVETKDRAQISKALDTLLTDDAKISVAVSFFSFTQPEGARPTKQDFDKDTFITFIDNVLYPMTDYGFHAELDSFTLAPDRKSASIRFTSGEWGDGNSVYGGLSVGVRYSANAVCDGQAILDGPNLPRLNVASCELKIRTVPKPEDMEKLRQHPDALGDYLK